MPIGGSARLPGRFPAYPALSELFQASSTIWKVLTTKLRLSVPDAEIDINETSEGCHVEASLYHFGN